MPGESCPKIHGRNTGGAGIFPVGQKRSSAALGPNRESGDVNGMGVAMQPEGKFKIKYFNTDESVLL